MKLTSFAVLYLVLAVIFCAIATLSGQVLMMIPSWAALIIAQVYNAAHMAVLEIKGKE